ncbi:hypothetical protein EWU23_09265 [Cytophagaceae bacterium 50C-KIRBA]|uniref:SHOCT domain-containing protein n=1 Tax=Aquirufa beregesia TaxID=2516556 RepID=A0ABX0EVR2_9BACT|nr:hypothetical protein [Aquirufa beregesia]NGZ44666.1 hypothetical protein [Aquirufa beregesia]
MDKNILVGTIVGLVFASSLHIWKSDKISQTQKWILIPMFLFPPLQWVALMMVTLYNNYSSRNEELQENIEINVNSGNDLDQAIDNLVELRVKGIISFEELMKNIRVIEKKKLEKNLLKSKEFEQLKYLLDIDVISNEEFDIKVEQLKEKLKHDMEQLIKFDSENTPSIQDSLFNPDFSTKESTFKFVYALFSIGIIFVIVFGMNYYNFNPIKDIFFTEEKVETYPISTNNSTPTPTIQYVPEIVKSYVIINFKIKIPKLIEFKSGEYTLDRDYMGYESTFDVNWEESTITSKILEVDNFDFDKENKLLDDYESEIYGEIRTADDIFFTDVIRKCNNSDVREKLLQNKTQIISRSIDKYNTYSEASLAKRSINNLN